MFAMSCNTWFLSEMTLFVTAQRLVQFNTPMDYSRKNIQRFIHGHIQVGRRDVCRGEDDHRTFSEEGSTSTCYVVGGETVLLFDVKISTWSRFIRVTRCSRCRCVHDVDVFTIPTCFKISTRSKMSTIGGVDVSTSTCMMYVSFVFTIRVLRRRV